MVKVSHIIMWIKSARSLILWPVSGLQFNLGALFLRRHMQKEKFCTSVNNVQLRRNYFSTKFPTHIIRASPRALPVWDFGHDLGRSFRHRIRLVADFAQPTSILQEIVKITKSSSIAPLPNVLWPFFSQDSAGLGIIVISDIVSIGYSVSFLVVPPLTL